MTVSLVTTVGSDKQYFWRPVPRHNPLKQRPHVSSTHSWTSVNQETSSPRHENGRTRDSAVTHSDNTSNTSLSSARPRPNGKRSRAMMDDDNDEDEEDHSKRRSSDRKIIPPAALKFACPFFKRNPTNHRAWRSCAGPGWDTIHRVK